MCLLFPAACICLNVPAITAYLNMVSGATIVFSRSIAQLADDFKPCSRR